MAESFEGRDLSGAEFWGVGLRGAHFRDVDLTDVTMHDVRLVDVDIDALVDNVTINGVDVTEYVNARDPWYPLRSLLHPTDVEGMRTALSALEDVWGTTIAEAALLPEAALHESVDGEWSFVETLRHLVFAMDKWFTAPILGEPFHPIVLPNRGSADQPWPGIDRAATPTFAEALGVWRERQARLHDYLEQASAADFAANVDVLENGTTPVRDCLHVVFEEEFADNRYAKRDLAALAGGV